MPFLRDPGGTEHLPSCWRAPRSSHTIGFMGGERDFDNVGARRALLEWYDRERRDLPWRRTRDPYAIWVSEVMLQQTQVSRVLEYWPRFLERFPSVRSLAEAPLDDVLAIWSGLGYYRRARLFHAAAQMVVSEFGGRIPTTSSHLRRLPGMGAYTSAAVASIAFGEAVAVIDANVVRVLSRLHAIEGAPSRGPARTRVRDEAAALLDESRPGDHNQAAMELGALVCAPSTPRCGACPVRRFCLAFAAGEPESYPQFGPLPEAIELSEVASVLVNEGAVLLVRGEHERGWWEGLWTLPRAPLADGTDPAAVARTVLAGRCGLDVETPGEPRELRYGVTNHRVTMVVVPCRLVKGGFTKPRRVAEGGSAAPSHLAERGSATPPTGRWFTEEELLAVGVPAPDRRAILGSLEEGLAPERIGPVPGRPASRRARRRR
jgi:A/G-specific adenine glycosylase